MFNIDFQSENIKKKCLKFVIWYVVSPTTPLLSLFKLVLNMAPIQRSTFSTYYNAYIGKTKTNEPQHEISNNVVFATSKASDQPAHTRSLIRAFASRLNIL